MFSLTPVWLLSVWGIWLWLRGGDGRLRQVAAGVALLAIVCLVFYIGLRPQQRSQLRRHDQRVPLAVLAGAAVAAGDAAGGRPRSSLAVGNGLRWCC